MAWTEDSQRATRVVLGAFRGMPGMETGDRKTDVQDLITNLLHVLRESGHTPELVLDSAFNRFREEADEILEAAEAKLASLEPYEERYRDIQAERIVLVEDAESGSIEQIEIYGKQLDGKRTWLLVHGPIEFETRQMKPEPVLYETTLVVSHYAESDTEARQLSHRVGDLIFEREDVVKIEGSTGDDGGAVVARSGRAERGS